MEKKEIAFIRPKLKHDYYHENVEGLGYTIFTPYKDNTLFKRLLREMWFRLGLPRQDFWYNKSILQSKAKVFVVKDPLITQGFLKWLRLKKEDCQIVFSYSNRISSAISPEKVCHHVDKVFSYDKDDCNKYGLIFRHPVYLDYFRLEKKNECKFDVVYVGRDKGRADYLLELKRELESMKLKVYFHISPSRSFLLFKKGFYKPFMPYEEYMKMISQTKSIVNIVQPGQTSITLRDMESVFNSIKCITNNDGIADFELYDPSRFFILGKDKDLIAFLESPYKSVCEEQLEDYKFDTVLESMVGGSV